LKCRKENDQKDKGEVRVGVKGGLEGVQEYPNKMIDHHGHTDGCDGDIEALFKLGQV
jgi:hypothetical protein